VQTLGKAHWHNEQGESQRQQNRFWFHAYLQENREKVILRAQSIAQSRFMQPALVA
jgi:hypothetical protein